MRERRALRAAGGAAREEDHERVVLVDGDVGQRTRRALGRASTSTSIGTSPSRCRPRRAARAAASSPNRTVGVGELHAVRELGAGPPAVEPDDDRAEARPPPSSRQRVVEAVGARERDPVALAHAVLVGEHRGDRAATLPGTSANVTVSSGNTRYGRSPNCVGAGPRAPPPGRAAAARTPRTGARARLSVVRLERRAGPESAARCSGVSRSSSCQSSVRHVSLSTRSAFSRRNFGHTWSWNGTSACRP